MEQTKGWQVFQIYNGYRFLLILSAFCYHYFDLAVNDYDFLFQQQPYFIFIVYAGLVSYASWRTYRQLERYETLVIASILVDLFVLNLFILHTGTLDHGVGILLNIAIAALAISLPGIIALFFAAFESILLLSYAYSKVALLGSGSIFYAGVHGFGFFTTAITSLSLAHWVKSSNKIADQRRHEIASLQELNAHIIEKINSVIILVDHTKKPLFVNEAARQWFGISPSILPVSLDVMSQELANFYDDYFAGNHKGEEQYFLKNAEQWVTLIPYGQDGKSSVVLILDDAKALMAQAHQLKLVSLGRFTASIAHELRNPLSAISHASQLLAQSQALSVQDQRFNQIITNNCSRMNELIKNVLQLSRQETSKPATIQLVPFLKRVIKDHPKHKHMHIIFNSESKDVNVRFDGSQLSQLLVILFDNAFCYGKNKDKKTYLHLSISLLPNRFIRLRVMDEGKGIEQALANDIFEPFFTTSRQGVGLGLFIAKELCTANKAKIILADTPKISGACFDILLPGADE